MGRDEREGGGLISNCNDAVVVNPSVIKHDRVP